MIELLKIEGLNDSHQSVWQVRALAINGRSPVLTELLAWQKDSAADYRKIMKVLRIVGQFPRLTDSKKVKKSSNPKHHNIYEMRADKGHARLMFFYSEDDEAVIVCTTPYWKGRGNQANAFNQCAALQAIYLQEKS
jgi:hypothetical protein